MSEQKLQECVRSALKNEDIHNYSITNHGTGSKTDGYLGDIFFVTVSGTVADGKHKTINLVIKASKNNEALRQQTPVREAFEKEIFIYTRVLQSFQYYQQEVGVSDLLTFMPRCYFTKTAEDGELLVLEDLKSQQYRMWNKYAPMTFPHVKLVLEAYGKWHAFSFALRRKKPEVFEELTKDNVNMECYWFEKTNMIDVAFEQFEKTRDVCLPSEKEDTLSKLKFTRDDAYYMFKGLFEEDPDCRVISHADCWNNNFMFKYENNSSEPTGVKILDWQCSGLSSPVMDLSHFIFNCCNTEEHRDVSELLKVYYDSFSNCLKCLHCDPDELFSYTKLVEHWKRFSHYGILLQSFLLKMTLSAAKEAPNFDETAEQGKEYLENFNFKISNEELYYRRVKHNLLHYVENLKLGVS